MSAETILVVTPEVARALRTHGQGPASLPKRVLPRGPAKVPHQQASEIESLVGKWGGVLVPMHEHVEGDLSTYFVVEHVSPRTAEALVSEFQHSPGVLSSYIKPGAAVAGDLEAGPYVTFNRARRA